MIILLLKLLLAHFIGDFLLQPKQWVKDKAAKKYRSKYFYLHGLVHLVLLLIILQFQFLPALLIIVFSHLLIDLMKLQFKHKLGEQLSFILDQVLHLIVIALIVNYYYPFQLQLEQLISADFLLLALCLILLSSVSSVVIRVFMAKWNLLEDLDNHSLSGAGNTIGILERLFIFAFILIGQWSAIGFLLAAKSVFRFGDLSRAKDRKLTEYILIGTLLSFGFAVLIGLFYTQIVKTIA